MGQIISKSAFGSQKGPVDQIDHSLSMYDKFAFSRKMLGTQFNCLLVSFVSHDKKYRFELRISKKKVQLNEKKVGQLK